MARLDCFVLVPRQIRLSVHKTGCGGSEGNYLASSRNTQKVWDWLVELIGESPR